MALKYGKERKNQSFKEILKKLGISFKDTEESQSSNYTKI